ncbi:uncharacterized protein LOC112693339 [Sipha flava]|uniref:Uncharacterized protein LOC112693339 n=1 Tax=Sipha flava TaxID=143950 RepID=A0A2S2QQC1_9HEMI|nr:uncharacterized protein LOC112693339 [Sipha flava]
MMHSEALVWLTTGIGGPLSVVWLCWAILVLWFGRGQWRPSDPLLIALLAEAIAKQAAGTAGSALSLFRPDEPAMCSAVQWLWTAAHTMQAGTLASLALMAGLRRKKRTVAAGGRPLLLYHLASLSVVSACVGAAALIAQTDPCSPPSDRRYAVFSLVLHASLALVAGASAAFGCVGHRKGPNPLLVNSSSDLSSCMSEISTVSSCSRGGIRHSVSDCSDRTAVTCTTSATAGGYRAAGAAECAGLVHDLLRLPSAGGAPPVTFLSGAPRAEDDTLRRLDETKRLIDSGTLMAASDRDSYAASTIRPYRYGCGGGGHGSRYLPSTAASVSVSSTNSRAPCLAKRVSLVQDVRIGYVVAILFMCYFVDHLPVLVLMASEHFIPSKFVFSADYAPVVKNFPMLAALAEACLWPVILLLFDDQFVPRLSNLYRRRSASERAKPPQGLHGKFRPYNGSLQDARRPTQSSNSGGTSNGETVRFPITNGSLFASLDGRVPVLHNYRRGVRTMSGLLVPPLPPHFVHSTSDPAAGHCCDDEHHHHHLHQQQQQHHRSLRFANMVTASATMSTIAADDCKTMTDDSCTPVDSLDDAIIMATSGSGGRPSDSRLPQNLQQLREKLYAQDDDDDDDDMGGGVDGDEDRRTAGCCGADVGRRVDGLDGAAVAVADDGDSSDDGCERRDDCVDEDDEGEYATLSARSVCSATTAANDDFEYFAAAADRPTGGGVTVVTADSGPSLVQPTVAAGVQAANAGGRVPYQRAPTRRARHHQQSQQHQQHQQQHHRHHHHHHHHQTPYQQNQYQHHRQMRSGSTPQPALPPTPPTPRRAKSRLTPVLSVDSLVAAQAAADATAAAGRYPRDFVQPQHQNHHHGGRHRGGFGGIAGRRLGGGGGRGRHGGSVPDLKRVFVTDFL